MLWNHQSGFLMVKKNYQLEINFACSAEDTEQLKLAVVIVAGRENHWRIKLQRAVISFNPDLCTQLCNTSWIWRKIENKQGEQENILIFPLFFK